MLHPPCRCNSASAWLILPALCADQAGSEPIQPPHAGACPPQNGAFRCRSSQYCISVVWLSAQYLSCADWVGGQPIQPAHAGAIAVWNPHAAALHLHQRLPDLSKDRSCGAAAVVAMN